MPRNRINEKSLLSKYSAERLGSRKIRKQRNVRPGGRNKEEKKRYNRRTQAIGRPDVLRELSKPETIYILGEEPVYLHSHHVYYKWGQKVAAKDLENNLQYLAKAVKDQLNNIIPILDDKVETVVNFYRCNNFEEFQTAFSAAYDAGPQKLQEVIDGSSNKDVINQSYYAIISHDLNIVKQLKTKINAFTAIKDRYRKQIKNDESKINKYLEDLNKTLIYYHFIEKGQELTWDSDKQSFSTVSNNANISTLRKETRDMISDIDSILKDSSGQIKLIETTEGLNELLSKITESKASSATDIGNAAELLADSIKEITIKGISTTLKNVAPERQSNTKLSNTFYKADTQAVANNNDIEFLISDKTGTNFFWDSPDKGINVNSKVVDCFTAGLATSTYDLNNNSSINIDEVEFGTNKGQSKNIKNAMNYLMQNMDFFKEKMVDIKKIIIAYFAWSKIVLEVASKHREHDNEYLVPFVRFFDRIYKTSDILKTFTTINDMDIVKYVNKLSYRSKFFDTGWDGDSKSDKTNLYKKKKEAIFDMVHGIGKNDQNGDLFYEEGKGHFITYKKLKMMIDEELKDLNKHNKVREMDLTFRIRMDNITKSR